MYFFKVPFFNSSIFAKRSQEWLCRVTILASSCFQVGEQGLILLGSELKLKTDHFKESRVGKNDKCYEFCLDKEAQVPVPFSNKGIIGKVTDSTYVERSAVGSQVTMS